MSDFESEFQVYLKLQNVMTFDMCEKWFIWTICSKKSFGVT